MLNFLISGLIVPLVIKKSAYSVHVARYFDILQAITAMNDSQSDTESNEWDVISEYSQGEKENDSRVAIGDNNSTGGDNTADTEHDVADSHVCHREDTSELSITPEDAITDSLDNDEMYNLPYKPKGNMKPKVDNSLLFRQGTKYVLLSLLGICIGLPLIRFVLGNPLEDLSVEYMVIPSGGFPSNAKYWAKHTAKCQSVYDDYQEAFDECARIATSKEVCMNAYGQMLQNSAEFCGWDKDELIAKQSKHFDYIRLQKSIGSMGKTFGQKVEVLTTRVAKLSKTSLNYSSKCFGYTIEGGKSLGSKLTSSGKAVHSFFGNQWHRFQRLDKQKPLNNIFQNLKTTWGKLKSFSSRSKNSLWKTSGQLKERCTTPAYGKIWGNIERSFRVAGRRIHEQVWGN